MVGVGCLTRGAESEVVVSIGFADTDREGEDCVWDSVVGDV